MTTDYSVVIRRARVGTRLLVYLFFTLFGKVWHGRSRLHSVLDQQLIVIFHYPLEVLAVAALGLKHVWI